jgi:hypothetical protein
LLTVLGPDATVAFFSDHGEEFWDHGRAEHGHSFHEELLRVPLILRDPQLPPGRCEAPVTLLDVAPSVLELAGLGSGRDAGHSLVDAARGNAAALTSLEERPLVFGRPLYGADGWGVTQRGMKWYSQGGGQFLYDLRRDPGETSNEVRLVWRVLLLSPTSSEDVVLTLRHPSGIERAWPTYDPNEHAEWSAPEVVDGTLRIAQSAGKSMPRAVYVLPAGDPLDPRGLTVSLSGDGSEVTAAYTGARLRFGGGTGTTVFEAGDDRRRFAVFFAYVPLPSGVEVPGFDPDVAEELRELRASRLALRACNAVSASSYQRSRLPRFGNSSSGANRMRTIQKGLRQPAPLPSTGPTVTASGHSGSGPLGSFPGSQRGN